MLMKLHHRTITTNGNWKQIGGDISGELAGDYSGNSISLSEEGSVIAVGAFFNDGSGEDRTCSYL